MLEVCKVLPGKTNTETAQWLPFYIHSVDTAGVMGKLASEWLPDHTKNILSESMSYDMLIPFCKFLGYIHDIGKMTALMASKMTDENGIIRGRLESSGLSVPDQSDFKRDLDKTSHPLAGESILIANGVAPEIASIIGSHHGMSQNSSKQARKNIRCYPYNYYGACSDAKEAQKWQDAWNEWIDYALCESGFSSVSDLPHVSSKESMLLCALLIIADWIASNTDFFPLISVEDDGSEIDTEQRLEMGWSKAGFTVPIPFNGNHYDFKKFEDEFGFSANDLQKNAIDIGNKISEPGIIIVEAQMGMGKTELALALTEMMAEKSGCGGVYYGLPTQATADGIFKRFERWAEKQDGIHSMKLAHGKADLNDDYSHMDSESNLFIHNWMSGRKRALLSDFVIGTVDQLLMAGLKQRHVMMRLIGLSGKVVVLDEVHAYDAYMNSYLDDVLSLLGMYHVPVILLSATLPPQRRGEMVSAYMNGRNDSISDMKLDTAGYPLLTWSDGDAIHQQALTCDCTRKEIQIRMGSEKYLPIYIKTAKNKCIGIICNTVKRAQDIEKMLKEKLTESDELRKDIILIHSHFTDADRAEKEKEILERTGKNSTESDRNLIVIGTQVLEQSLDIDFDMLITDLCPMDLLLQRIGRLYRHKRNRTDLPYCIVLGADKEIDKGAEAVYGRWLLTRTKSLLPDAIVLPDMISDLVCKTYAELDEDTLSDAEQYDFEKYKFTIQDKQMRAEAFQLPDPRGRSTMDGMFDGNADECGQNEKIKEAGAISLVRDADFSIDVILMVEYPDGIGFFPWQNNGRRISVDDVPDQKESKLILRQRINLPHVLCMEHFVQGTIDELESQNQRFDKWRESSLLKYEYVLVLDENYETTINGFRLRYNKEIGLTYEQIKEEKNE